MALIYFSFELTAPHQLQSSLLDFVVQEDVPYSLCLSSQLVLHHKNLSSLCRLREIEAAKKKLFKKINLTRFSRYKLLA